MRQGSRRPRGTRALPHSSGLHPGAQRPSPLAGNGSLRPLPHPRPGRPAARLPGSVDRGYRARFSRRVARLASDVSR